jgi:curli biogenesis system outer membrane secretion channel CsgG
MRKTLIAMSLLIVCAGCRTDPNAAYFMRTETRANVYVAAGQNGIHRVAILPFKGPTELVGNSVSDMMVTEILRAGCYDLVERSQMSKVLSESELALAGLSVARAAEVGNMIGADGVIIGTVDEYSTVALKGSAWPVVGISARLIDCRSGQVVWSVDLAERAASPAITLAQQGRKVVHEMIAAVYKALR